MRPGQLINLPRGLRAQAEPVGLIPFISSVLVRAHTGIYSCERMLDMG